MIQGEADSDPTSGATRMRRFRCPSCRTIDPRRRGSASIDFVLILGVVLPLVAFVLPASRVAIQASFAWFCRVTTSPFL